jgi:N-methylhydantoinase B
MRVTEVLELVGDGPERSYRCLRCQHSLGPAAANYKLTALVEEAGLAEANPHIGDPFRYVDEAMVFRRYYCPGCGVLLDSEVARAQDAPLHDVEIN